MHANEVVEQVTKKTYVKPTLATHGSVQQLTEGGHKSHSHGHDDGSGIGMPSFSDHGPTSWDW